MRSRRAAILSSRRTLFAAEIQVSRGRARFSEGRKYRAGADVTPLRAELSTRLMADSLLAKRKAGSTHGKNLIYVLLIQRVNLPPNGDRSVFRGASPQAAVAAIK